jgi:alkylation response protein AidB-like acyl-CoA dehydrogenase
MDFSIPQELEDEISRFRSFVREHLEPQLAAWHRQRELPREFFAEMGRAGWYGFAFSEGRLVRRSALREALLAEELARHSGGAAIGALAHADLGMMGLHLYGSEQLQRRYGEHALKGQTIMCLGSTESRAGSDAAGVTMQAESVSGGWKLSGTKAYVTNGAVADLAVVTAVTNPGAHRNARLSMFLVDLKSDGARRFKLNKQVWVPSDLTRLELRDVRVPADHLLGTSGRGLQQVLGIFTHSRVAIAGLTLGTAAGAFDLAVQRAVKRTAFGQRIADLQAKSFEIADLHAGIEAARLMLWKACWKMDRGEKFREESSLAKYLAVGIARKATAWAADLFGAASVMLEHPIHKFPMDAWGAALGEGTQDVQKLIIFREVIKPYLQTTA